MEAHWNGRFCNLVRGSSKLFHFVNERKLAPRGVAVLVIAAMLMPAVYLGGVRMASARSLGPMRESALISAPPEPFVVPGSESGVRGLLAFGGSSWQFLNDFVSPAQSSKFQVQRSEFRVPAKAPSLGEKFTTAIASGVASLFALVVPLSKKENSPLSTLNSPLLPPPAGTVTFDFDGDGKADIGRWHGANTEFKVKNSSSGSYTTTTIGSGSAKPAPADYDGDTKTDAAVFNAGTWNIKQSSNGSAVTITSFGQAGDVPVPGNWVGTTAIDAAVYRPSNGT